jgi:vitamin B12 transporter
MKCKNIFSCLSVLLMLAAITTAQQTTEHSQDSLAKHLENKDTILCLDRMVVTATRTAIPLREVASSVTIITSDEILKNQDRFVLDALRGQLGLDVSAAGGAGTQSSVFMRGSNSTHTLVLVDGIEVNDPISAGRGYNFADLTTTSIDHIEIVQGPQSTLYGSDAIGGVINIITKRGGAKKSSFLVSGEGGSFKTLNGTASASGTLKPFDYSLDLTRYDAEGFSAANGKYGNNEKDGYENTTFSSKLGAAPLDNLFLDFVLRYVDSKTDIDNFGGPGGDDPNDIAYLKQISSSTRATLSLFNDLWRQILSFSLNSYDRTYTNDVDAAHPLELSHGSYNSRLLKLNWQNNLRFHPANTFTLGMEGEYENGKSDYYSQSSWGPYTSVLNEKSFQTAACYLQDHISLWHRFYTTLGARFDYNKSFGFYPTYRIGSVYAFENIGARIRATLGTGFKAPSLFQLYSEYGYVALKPENSFGWDMGVDQSFLKDIVRMGATYFSNSFSNLIDFDNSSSKYMNISECQSKGVELFLALKPFSNLEARGNYTFTDARDLQTGKELLQRPKHKLKGTLSYSVLEKANISIEGIYVGDRYDYPRVKLLPYQLLNAALSYDITDAFGLFCRVENILDEDYEEVSGYGTAGVSCYTGFRLSF